MIYLGRKRIERKRKLRYASVFFTQINYLFGKYMIKDWPRTQHPLVDAEDR